ncbi:MULTISPECIES: beta-ketoacyl-[acyl-carrier-protein] synthase family protein [unclassified Actinopolyspora]|uniref:beta-ketoacyl-[acyl-carrier-protein] synthase family protein n=1 Tax=unclassified Actinopolyspora TaxID=2639451 RepID=UPI0013F60D14|nr:MULTISPECIES: beta-ketoacyl-[acyl-carrier-protein] synthase family protein [unclassified Actinopolyspora]NHD15990.1 beta-ketoacyl-[acyl-carrier-protein] synthase family protein [Actinopolyspora sp. BKK2]NHE74796.1 beta-ketoacyl-[acyl-carrier-protein] synthase family protein [Actinopolyspora sp. BKK1]
MTDPTDSAAEPVAITGIGLVLPGAHTVREFWSHLSLGNSQVTRLRGLNPEHEGLAVRAGAEITEFDHRRFLPDLPERHAAKYSREILATMSACTSAFRDSGLQHHDVDPRKLSLVESSSRGALEWWLTRSHEDTTDSGAMFRGLLGSAASLTAIQLGARGLVTTVSSACVGGHHAIGLASRELRSHSSDAVLVGGHDFPLVPEVLRTFEALGPGVLSGELERPEHAIRPYDRDRAGMVLGEAAVTLCLERASSAQERGARPYAHVLEHGAMNEAAHATSMDITGKRTADLVRETVFASGRRIEDVGYYCGHGTATRSNDLAESRTVRALHPDLSPSALPPLGSNKPIFGHTLGAAGIINVAATALMLHHQWLAPTINLVDVDPACDIDHVAHTGREARFDLAVSLAFAIGSQTSVVALGAPDA